MEKKKMEAISDDALDQVSGGTVYISNERGMVGFSALGERYTLNTNYREASNLANSLWYDNQNLSDTAFDELVKAEFQARGWI